MNNLLRTVVALVALSSAASAQSVPPVKMGLWQSTSVSTITGLQLPPEVVARFKAMGRPLPGSAPRTTITQACFTPEKWQESLQRAQLGQDCHTRNFKQDSSGISADIDCKNDRGSSSGHVQIDFLSSEKMHGTSNMEAISEQNPQPMKMNFVFDSIYQGPDCKGISPGSAKVVPH